jgi:predicted ATP-dependent serine protease
MRAKAIKAFECVRCRKIRRDREKAEACCTCRCGKPVTPRFWGKCDKCGARNAARSMVREIKQRKERLARDEQRLSELRKQARS